MGSVFSHHRTNADRSAKDLSRHKQKIEKAIREGIHDIVAEESIIGQDGKKKIRIPVRGIKEYRFVYGQNQGGQGGNGEGGIGPKLAGQAVSDIADKLTGYRAGEPRGAQSAMMWPVAKPMTDDDIGNIAAYIATM